MAKKQSEFDKISSGSYNGKTYQQAKQYDNEFDAISDNHYTFKQLQREDEEKKKKKNILENIFDNWVNEGALKDGYQVGDFTKGTISTLSNARKNLQKGINSNVEGLIDTGANVLVSGALEALDQKEAAQKVREWAQKDFITESQNKGLGKYFNTAGTGMGIGSINYLALADQLNYAASNKDASVLNPFNEEAAKKVNQNVEEQTVFGSKTQGVIQGVGQLAGQVALTSVGVPWQLTAFGNGIGNEMNEAFANGATYGDALLSGIISGAVEVGTEYLGGGADKLLGMSSLTSKLTKNFGKKMGKSVGSYMAKLGIDAMSEGAEEVLSGLGSALGKKLTYMSDKEFNEIYSSEEALNDFITGSIVAGVAGVPVQLNMSKNGVNPWTEKTASVERAEDAIEVIERKNNAKLSDENKLILNNMSEAANRLDAKITTQQLVESFNEYKEEQKNKFQDSAKNLFPNLDLKSEKLYNNLINDVSKFMYDTGITIEFDPTLKTVSEKTGNSIKLNPTLTSEPIKTLLLKELGSDLLDNNAKANIIKGLKKNGVYDALKQELLATGEFDEANVDNEIVSRELNDLLVNPNKLTELAKTNKEDVKGLKGLINDLSDKLGFRTTKDATYLRQAADTINKINLDKDIATKDLKIDKNRKVVKEKVKPTTTTTQQTVEQNENVEKKQRSAYDTVLKSPSQTTKAKEISKKLIGLDTYVPDSNQKELQRADEHINKYGVEDSLKMLKQNTESTRNNVDDIAIGNRLIEYYSKVGDEAGLTEAIQLTAMAGTNVGRAVQAMSLLNRMTPAGQATWIQRSVDQMNKKMQEAYDKSKNPLKKLQQFNFTSDMQQKIINSTEENLEQNLDEVYKELGNQVQMSFLDAVESWRYFAMLSSPTTHIRNIVGNLMMGEMQDVKNFIRGGIEDVAFGLTGKEGERTATLGIAPKEYYDFAAKDMNNVKGQLGLGDNKYTKPKTQLQQNMRMFGNGVFGKFLEATVKKGAIDLTSKALEIEDVWGLKSAYKKNMAKYLYANKIDINNITDSQLAKARAFAIDAAKQATFHQDNAISTALNTIEKQNLFTKVVVGGIVPFKKTPLNVAGTALAYNPVGLMKTLTYDSLRLYNGEINANQWIDNVSKGLTGTGIAVIGYALAQAGILKTNSDDDKDYESDRGIQPYSIQIGNKTISLDWLSPTAVPMFVGAELYRQVDNMFNDKPDKEKQVSIKDSVLNLLNAGVSSLNPVSEMTMLSGLQSAMKTYSGDYAKMAEEIGTNTIKSFVNQFTPSILGKAARTIDDKERSTTTTKKTTVEKAIDTVWKQTLSKIPGARNFLPVKTDVWGNEIKQDENIASRAAYNFLSPATIKDIRETDLDKEINRLYDATGEKSVLPKTYTDKYFTFDNKEYRLNSNEYAAYKQALGKNNYEILNRLIKTNDYKNLSDNDKAKLISEIYSYDKSVNKDAYAKINNITYTPSKTYTSQKNSIALGGNIEDYLLYNMQDFKADVDASGNTISGSKKLKIINYLNKKKMNYNQKLYLLAKDYAVSTEEKTYLAYLINNSNLTVQEKKNLYKSLTGFKVDANGNVRW